MLLGEIRSRGALLRGSAGRRAGEDSGTGRSVYRPGRVGRSGALGCPWGRGSGGWVGRSLAGLGRKDREGLHSSGVARGSAAVVDGARRPQGLDCRACGRSRSWALPLAHSYDCTLWRVGVSWNGQECSGLVLGILGVWLFSGILLVRRAAGRGWPAAPAACSRAWTAARSLGRPHTRQATDGGRHARERACSRTGGRGRGPKKGSSRVGPRGRPRPKRQGRAQRRHAAGAGTTSTDASVHGTGVEAREAGVHLGVRSPAAVGCPAPARTDRALRE